MEQEQSSFSGWAVVELFGHQREVGFVTTQAFGQAVMFRIDEPELDGDREYATERPTYVDGRMAPTGTVVKRKSGSSSTTRRAVIGISHPTVSKKED
jgi:hypothetical protein